MTRPEGSAAAELEQAARDDGFVVSWSAVTIPDAWRASYERWIAEQRNAGVGQLARGLETRLEPRARFGWARSVMVLAAPQAYPDPGAPPDGMRLGRVARRFWVREPEPFFLKRLLEPSIVALKQRARELDVRCRDYVDQGPLPGNLYAVLSGRFWRGRNAMPLSADLGTRFTVASLLTDLAFADEPGDEHPDRCGNCTRCVDACPTGALLGDRRVDLNLCVSYWTTTHLGPIPGAMWDGIGTWLLGCDICQDVCPWNRQVDREGWAWNGYRTDPELAHPRLDDLIGLGTSAFAQRFAGSAFERLGRARAVRNALIVLSNSGNPRAHELIVRAAADESPLVRATAARALVRVDAREEAEALVGDRDATVRAQARDALSAR